MSALCGEPSRSPSSVLLCPAPAPPRALTVLQAVWPLPCSHRLLLPGPCFPGADRLPLRVTFQSSRALPLSLQTWAELWVPQPGRGLGGHGAKDVPPGPRDLGGLARRVGRCRRYSRAVPGVRVSWRRGCPGFSPLVYKTAIECTVWKFLEQTQVAPFCKMLPLGNWGTQLLEIFLYDFL